MNTSSSCNDTVVDTRKGTTNVREQKNFGPRCVAEYEISKHFSLTLGSNKQAYITLQSTDEAQILVSIYKNVVSQDQKQGVYFQKYLTVTGNPVAIELFHAARKLVNLDLVQPEKASTIYDNENNAIAALFSRIECSTELHYLRTNGKHSAGIIHVQSQEGVLELMRIFEETKFAYNPVNLQRVKVITSTPEIKKFLDDALHITRAEINRVLTMKTTSKTPMTEARKKPSVWQMAKHWLRRESLAA